MSIRGKRLAAARRLGTHTYIQWLAILYVCDYRCVKCRTKDARLEKDHIKPIYQGGSDAIENIQPLCARCNCGKGPDSSDLRPADALLRMRNMIDALPDWARKEWV